MNESNATRSLLIQNSINFYWNESPVFGLGIKPIDREILGGLPYPIGSHSTIVGSFVKSGLIGGLLLLLFYISLISKWIKLIFQFLLTSIKFNKDVFYTSICIMTILIASFFEDIDAYELIPLYLGMLLYLFREKLNFTNHE